MTVYFTRLKKDTLIYGIGTVAGNAVGFFLLPIYTRLFSPIEYGAIEMLAVLGNMIGLMISMGLDSAQSYYFMKTKKEGIEKQAEIISSIFQWRIITSIIALFLALFLVPIFNKHLFNNTNHSVLLYAAVFSSIIFGQITTQAIDVLRLIFRPWPFIIMTISKVSLGALTAITLIYIFDMGILGYFLGAMTGALLIGIISWWNIRPYLNINKLHINIWPIILKFGLPLVPVSFGMYVITSADRWFLAKLTDEHQLAIYAVAAKLSLIILLVVKAFRMAWWPIALDAMHKGEGNDLVRMIAKVYLVGATTMLIILTALTPILIFILVPDTYNEAIPLVGIMSWYGLGYGFALISSIGIWMAEKTYLSGIVVIIVALLNVIFNSMLVPKYGAIGAAISTAISAIIWQICILLISEKLWKINYPIKQFGGILVIGLIYTSIVTTLYIDNNYSYQYITSISVISIILIILVGLNSEIRNYLKKSKMNKTNYFI